MQLRALNGNSGTDASPYVYQADPYHLVVQGDRVDDHAIPLVGNEVANTIPALLAVDAVCHLRGSMTMADVYLMLQRFSDSAFRIEIRDSYLEEEEADALVRFRGGGDADSPAMAAWRTLIAGHVAAGHTMRRVHLVRLPLSEYLRWEFAAQAGSVAAGEDIRVIDLDQHPEFDDLDEDVWLLDNRVAVCMVYETDGRLFRPERLDEAALERSRVWRDRVWEVATPLVEFMAGV